MSVPAQELWHNSPNVIRCGKELALRLLDGRHARRGPVDQGDDSSVAAAIEHFLQPDLQRAELASLGTWIDDQETGVGIDDRRQLGGVGSSDHDHKLPHRLPRADGGGKKRPPPPRYQLPFTPHPLPPPPPHPPT